MAKQPSPYWVQKVCKLFSSFLLLNTNMFLFRTEYRTNRSFVQRERDELNDEIIKNLKDSLLCLCKINRTEREITEQIKTSLNAEIKKSKILLEGAYEELDTAQKELHTVKTDLIYMKAVVDRIKRKYPNEDLKWAMKDENAQTRAYLFSFMFFEQIRVVKKQNFTLLGQGRD